MLTPHSQPLAGHKDEQDAEGCIKSGCHTKDHQGPFDEELADEGLADAGEVEGRVLAETKEGEDRVDGVLV